MLDIMTRIVWLLPSPVSIRMALLAPKTWLLFGVNKKFIGESYDWVNCDGFVSSNARIGVEDKNKRSAESVELFA